LTPVDSGLWDQDVLAMGLRNPQGIAVDELGRVWETEHAAMGGDELNLIAPGGNYGWPEVSLGVNYTDEASDVKYWPFNPEQGRHPGYAMPAYAWLPSVAPSSADFVHGLTPRWEGDLLVGTLKLGSLLRLRIEGNRVLYAEQIPFVRRIRYAAVAHGRIYVLFDNGELAVLTPREPVTNYVDFSGIFARDGQLPNPVSRVVSGSALAANGCFECHSGSAAARLPGILGTDIASQPGVAYSQALRSKSGNWTEDNLRAFLTDPQSFASGTTMPDRQISPAHIDAVIEEIRSPGG
jgi:cytochrome c2